MLYFDEEKPTRIRGMWREGKVKENDPDRIHDLTTAIVRVFVTYRDRHATSQVTMNHHLSSNIISVYFQLRKNVAVSLDLFPNTTQRLYTEHYSCSSNLRSSILILSSYTCLPLQNGLWPSSFEAETFRAFFVALYP